MQRLGLAVDEYAVLNIHQIGVEAPARYVFEELLGWNGDSTCWPNHIATVHRKEDRLENIEILLFGRKRYLPGLADGLFCLRESPLFDLNAIRIQRSPDPAGGDNARYLLYACSGGYPIGIFSMYARSSIPEQREDGQTQLFIVVGFDFYGQKRRPMQRLVGPLWEMDPQPRHGQRREPPEAALRVAVPQAAAEALTPLRIVLVLVHRNL